MEAADPEFQMVLACFAGGKRAAKVRRDLRARLAAGGEAVLDEVVLRVNAKGKAQVYDPHRVFAGTLTSALTWGAFGFVASGGWSGLAIWAVLGAVCGGGYAYLSEHLLTKTDLKRLGSRLPADSSALLLFVHGTADAKTILSEVAALDPGPASVVSVDTGLSATATCGASFPLAVESSGSMRSSNVSTLVNMLVFRYPGADTAKEVALEAAKASDRAVAVEPELVLRCESTGKYHVASPKQGVGAMSLSDVISWGLFGVVWGAVVGFLGNGSVLGLAEGAVTTGLGWAVFGLVAGALYGLWAGRATSARRLNALFRLLSPDTSMTLAWTEGIVTDAALAPWSTRASETLAVRFNRVPSGAVLEV
jgi:uncharacterized membrane protein